jgi:dipeptidyl aminopeptidase/acylaminoacyl peptidase
MQTDISDGLAYLAQQGIADPKRACIMGASYGGYAALAGVTLQNGIYRCAVSVAGVSNLEKLRNTGVAVSGGAGVVNRGMREILGSGSSLDDISPVRFAERADAPVLLIHGKDDIIVLYSQSTDMASALKRAGKTVELVTLQNGDHWLSTSETRLPMLNAAMAFVQKYNPADQ